MVRLASAERVREIGLFLQSSGYDVAHLADQLGLGESLHANLDNLEPMLQRTEGLSLIHVLARLFFVGWPVEAEVCRRVLPDHFVTCCTEAALLEDAGNSFEPGAIVLPVSDLLIACDLPRHRGKNPEMVIGPSPSSEIIERSAIWDEAGKVLDLGTGTGVLALQAARHSEHVTGVDISERAIEYARFNKALNGVNNVAFACGDSFEPVAGQRFSRIIANPPFFLSPAKEFTHCDSPMELDGFSRKLVAEAPRYLEEGGFFQMICEWVQIGGEPWQQRLRSWAEGSGCDVLIIQSLRLTPVDYAERRANEAKHLHNAQPESLFPQRMTYFRERQVEAIYGGLIGMKKRAGTNWISILPGEIPVRNAADAIRSRFQSIDLLAVSIPDDLLCIRFRVADDAVIEQKQILGREGWETSPVDLAKTTGFTDRLRLDEGVVSAVKYFDGTRTLLEIASRVAEELSLSEQDSQAHCLRLARRLLQSNFIHPV